MPAKLPTKPAFSEADDRLMIAAQRGDVGEIHKLLDAGGANPRAHDFGRKTALIHAAENGHLACVKALLARSFIAKVDKDGNNALAHAARNGHFNCVEFLSGFTDPDKTNRQGATPLSEAAAHGHGDCVAFLASKTDANKPDKEGRAALMRAAQNGNVECLRLLLPLSDSFAKDFFGQTPLILVVGSFSWGASDRTVAERLLQCVAGLLPVSDLSSRGHDGRTALELAIHFSTIQNAAPALRASRWPCIDALATAADLAPMEKFQKDFGPGFAAAFPRWSALIEAEQLARLAGLPSKTAAAEAGALFRAPAPRANRL